MTFEHLVAEGLVERDRPLGPLTTYRFGGPATLFAEVRDEAGLVSVLAARNAAAAEVPLLVLGRGSNLVVSDRGFDGLVVRLTGEFLAISIDDSGVVTAGGGVPLPRLARTSVTAGRGGLEFYVGIPGSVGGAVRMNAGCHGSETADWLVTARVVDAATASSAEVTPTQLDLRYRHSNLTDDSVVVSARFRTRDASEREGERVLREITRWRKEHQPGGTLNAGSVFKNPPSIAAGRLIDELGLKGFAVGGAAVSERHANFFVAGPDATAQDVHDLVFAVQERVAAATGIWLEPEIRFAGTFADAGAA